MIVVDNNVLVQIATYNHPKTAAALEAFLKQRGHTIGIPTPVLAEYLAYDFTGRYAQFFANHGMHQILEFDTKSAMRCGQITCKYHDIKAVLFATQKEQPARQKVKVDLQILAIALANNASVLISDDPHIATYVRELAGAAKIQVLTSMDICDMQPAEPQQESLNLDI